MLENSDQFQDKGWSHSHTSDSVVNTSYVVGLESTGSSRIKGAKFGEGSSLRLNGGTAGTLAVLSYWVEERRQIQTEDISVSQTWLQLIKLHRSKIEKND